MAKRRIKDIYPLTAMQQGMLVQALRTPDQPVYRQQYVLAVTGVADADVLRDGLAELVARHTVLRTGFVWEGVDAPVQVVFADATVPLTVVDGGDAEVAEALAEHRRAEFDLRKPPLLRAHAIRVGQREWRLVTTAHHLVLDGWSMPTIQSDLTELLSARVEHRAPNLKPAAPFREFVTWLRDNDNPGAAQAHFKQVLGDLRHPTPLGVDRVGRVSTEAGPAGRVERFREVPADRHPEPLARGRGLLPSTIVHAAWGYFLATCADSSNAVFGTTVSGRPPELPGVTERVGMFVNTVPVRVSVAGDTPVGPWLAQVQEQLIAGREFEQTPVSAAQRCSGVPMGEPLYETVLGFQNYFSDKPAGAAGAVTVRAVEQQEQTGLPLVVSVAFPPGAIWTRVEYDRSRVDDAVAGWIADRYPALLSELAATADDTPLSALALAGPVDATEDDLFAALPFGRRVAIALADDDPAREPLVAAARAAGAEVEFRDPARPGGTDAGTVVGSAEAIEVGGDQLAVVVGAQTVPGAIPVLAAPETGVFACGDRTRGVRRVDRLGRPVPGPIPGEVVVGSVHTGLWARERAEGGLEFLGPAPGSHDWWIARALAADPAVARAVVDGDGEPGEVHAWLVAADGRDLDLTALTTRLRKVVPPALLPTRFHQVLRLPADPAARRGGTVVRHPQPRPLAERLAQLPAARRTAFLDGLRAAQTAVPPIRPGRFTGAPPRSAQQEFYDEHPPLRPPPPVPEPSGLSYADYAAWQQDVRRTADRDRQAAHWRTVLTGAPASGIPADRVPADAPRVGERTVSVAATGSRAEWLAALATTLARWGRDDEVVLGVVAEPHLPDELTGVPGPFARMLPLRVPAGADPSTVEQALDAARHNADVPWSVLRSLLAEDPLVSVAVHDTRGPLAPHAAVTIGIDVTPSDSGTELTAVYDGTRVAERTVTDLLTRCATVLADGPEAELVTETELAELLALGDGGTTTDEPATVPTLVARQNPDALAVTAVDGDLTYRELLDKATALAGHLVELGVRPEDRVAIGLPRTTALVWAPLAVMLAGAAYVPVDPQYPEARIAVLCEGVRAVITTADLAVKFPEDLPVVAPDAGADHPLPDVRPDTAAYIIFTSGSTGQPKGVVVEHRSVVDFSRHIATAYGIDQDTRLLGFAAITFDVSVFDLWSALCAGATLVLAGDEERLSVDKLQHLLVSKRVTAAELPPSLMPLLDPAKLPDLRLVSVGGEAPAGRLVDDWATPEREFWNGYGPAETTVAVTLMRCTPPSGGRVPPIGKPMPNHRAYVLDDALRPVPVGVPGELCVAGAGVARGYLGKPGQTADRFVPDPFAPTPGARLYRTGDLVRWAPDGVLEFLGRVDRQVKIRGFRVELGEVEAVLAADPSIRQVAVEVWDDGETRHLTAYVVPAGDAPALADIRAIASAKLPDYMTPTRLAVLDALPRTPSGKVDRRALPAPAAPGGSAVGDLDLAAWTPLQRTIATEVIGPLLRLSDVDREQDFFELGGNSLQATQVTSRVRDRFGVEIGLADFFAEPTVVRLAALVEQEQGRAADREREVYGDGPTMDSGTILPQSFPQMALYQAEQDNGANARYNAPFALGMRGPLDLDALRKAFSSLVRRHPTLRVSLRRDGDDYVQQVRDDCEVPFTLSDVDGETPEAKLATVRRLIREEGAGGFDLVNGPLIRVRVHRLADDHHVVQWTVHHLATDGWSVGIQLHEVGTAYHAFVEGTEPELAPLDGNYAEFVAWHRDYVASPQYPKDVAWWRDELRGVAGLALPAKADRAGHEFRPGYLNMRIEPGLAADLNALGKQVGTSLYMTTFAAYATVLSAFSGRTDIAVVTPNALRVRSAWERLVGWFVNRVLVRLRIEDDATFADLLRTTRKSSMAAFAHQAVPFESLRSELELSDDVLAACFSVQNAPMAGRAFRSDAFDMDVVGDDSGLDFTPIGEVYAPLRLRYESSVVLRPREDGAVAGGWEYDAALFDEDTARCWSAGFVAVLAEAARNPQTPVRDLRAIAAATPPRHNVGMVDS